MRRENVIAGQATSGFRQALGMKSVDTRQMIFPGRLDLGNASSHTSGVGGARTVPTPKAACKPDGPKADANAPTIGPVWLEHYS
ncbi:hypothetical protein Pres01_30430 [Metapseudomonas resinovorans]|nr:hypothetical protein Pres01_30430 [Pseudomonas resinovorans]